MPLLMSSVLVCLSPHDPFTLSLKSLCAEVEKANVAAAPLEEEEEEEPDDDDGRDSSGVDSIISIGAMRFSFPLREDERESGEEGRAGAVAEGESREGMLGDACGVAALELPGELGSDPRGDDEEEETLESGGDPFPFSPFSFPFPALDFSAFLPFPLDGAGEGVREEERREELAGRMSLTGIGTEEDELARVEGVEPEAEEEEEELEAEEDGCSPSSQRTGAEE